jgi:O-antigen/teichoic acid export membrane protein
MRDGIAGASPVHGESVVSPGKSLLSPVARNSAFVLGMQLLLKVLAFLFNVYVVRRLGDVHFGQYATVMAYVGMFAIFTDWGMAPYAVREMAKQWGTARRLIPNVIAIRLLLSIVVIVVAPLSAFWLGKESGMIWGVFVGGLGLLFYAFSGPLDAALTARERLDLSSSFAMVYQLTFWGLGTVLLLAGAGVIGLLTASLVGVLVMALLSGWALARMGVGRLELSVRHWPGLLKAAFPFGVSGISYAFMQRFDTVLMSFVLTDAQVGWYNVPWTLMNMMLLAAQSIATAMYPSMVRSYAQDPESLSQVIWQSIKYLLIVCLPVSVGGTVLAERIILTLYGESFVGSVVVLQVLLWALPSLFLLELLGRVADTLHLEKPKATVNLANAGITVVLDLVLVPVLGILGAALALVGGRTIRLVQFWRLIGNDRLVGERWWALFRSVLAAAAMGIAVYGLTLVSIFDAIDPKIALVGLIGVGAVVYGVALLVSGGVELRELRFLYSALSERASGDSVQ